MSSLLLLPRTKAEEKVKETQFTQLRVLLKRWEWAGPLGEPGGCFYYFYIKFWLFDKQCRRNLYCSALRDFHPQRGCLNCLPQQRLLYSTYPPAEGLSKLFTTAEASILYISTNRGSV